MVPFSRIGEAMSCGLAKDFGMLMILGWHDLIPSANRFIGCLLSQLLRYRGFCEAFCFNDSNVQFISIVHERRFSCFSSSTCYFQWRHWFPRCCSFGANGYRHWECAVSPIGLNISGSKPGVSQHEIVRSHVCDIKS